MLTDADIDFMRNTREEITKKRERLVTLTYADGTVDEYTGEIVDGRPIERTVSSVVTELSSSSSAGAERYMENGIQYEKGDIWLSVAIDFIWDIADKMTHVSHDGKDYTILAADKKGIGKRNRYEILGRLVS
ncbi:hypothetical protein [Lederbergia citri]|uniref:Uncharacterized protein n=1 Tax=Lederbergia citri TaxID=2833580 RepID=A0A942YGA3_9BACI|nr:hypothetical protein [Lederbergia citri]MBS4195332.1 hypothetical protein [Lederbergia citri]